MCATIMLAIIVTALAHVTTSPDDVHVRFNNDRIREVVQLTLSRSPTFRQLVAAIELSDVIVYIDEGRCREGTLLACLHVLSTPGGRRLMIHLDPRQPLMSVAGQLAHELQHAAEIANDASAADEPSVRKLYERIGFQNCPRYGPECWETRTAQNTEASVLKEMSAGPANLVPAFDESYFGTWTLNVERSRFNGAPPPRASTMIVGDRGFGLISVVTHTMDLDGHTHDSSFVFRIDGRAYLASAPGAQPKVTIVQTAVDRFTARFVVESENEVIATGLRTIGGAGTEMTVEICLRDAYGQEMTSVTVWEKTSH
jgi:hypothetical protein